MNIVQIFTWIQIATNVAAALSDPVKQAALLKRIADLAALFGSFTGSHMPPGAAASFQVPMATPAPLADLPPDALHDEAALKAFCEKAA